MSLADVLRHLMTEADNTTHDLYRYLAVVSIIVGLGLQVFAVGWRGQPFDMQSFGIGVGALFTGAGLALKLKRESADQPHAAA